MHTTHSYPSSTWPFSLWRRQIFCCLMMLLGGIPLALQAQSNLPILRGIERSLSPGRILQLDQQFEAVEVFKLDSRRLADLLHGPAYQGEIMMQFGQRHQWHLSLYEEDIRSEAYQLWIEGPEGKQQLPRGNAITFRGSLHSSDGGEVRLTVWEDFIYGYISQGNETYFIEPVRRFLAGADTEEYAIYAASDVKDQAPMGCGVTDLQNTTQNRQQGPAQEEDPIATFGVCKRAEMVIGCDYSMLAKHGDVGSVVAYTLGVMNNVNGDYSGSFNDDVTFEIKGHYISTCEDCDYLSDESNANNLLFEFVAWGGQGNFNTGFDLAQFWTNRDLAGSTIGIAYVGVVCGSYRYHVLQDFRSSDASRTRVLVSHEIGHNFSAGHDASGSATIMAPAVSTATTWSANSVTSISSHISSRTCLDACAPLACPEITGLDITSQNSSSVSLSWNNNSNGSYRIRMRSLGSSSWSFSQTLSQTSYTLGNLSPCTYYEVELSSDCNGSYGPPQTLRVLTSKLELLSTQAKNCKDGAFDLEMVLSHGGQSGSLEVLLNGKVYPMAYGTSPQTLRLNRILPNNGQQGIIVQVRDGNNPNGPCLAEASFDAPGPNCDCETLIEADFNTCSLPPGWSATTTTSNGYASQYVWRFDDGNRSVQNLPNGTIDGTCMAFFDDDINSNTGYSGTITLTSPSIDLSNYEQISFEFDYDYHAFITAKGANASYFRVEVWNGNSWQMVLNETGIENCSWTSFWSCPPPRFSINVDAYKNAAFQVRFQYYDGNAWAGAAGIDNIKVCAYQSISPPDDLPTLPGLYTANREYTDQNGWTHYWKEASSTPVTPQDLLILSMQKNQDANLIVGPSEVSVEVLGQGSALDLGFHSPSPAPYVDSAKSWFVIPRYWNVNAHVQPDDPIEVRFYYRDQELTDLQSAVQAAGEVLSNHSELECYKFASGSGVNPNPGLGPIPHAGGDSSNFLLLPHSHMAISQGHYAEFQVSGFSGGGIGSSKGITNPSFPLEVLHFTGFQEAQHLVLQWTTIDEAASDKIEIERSLDGILYTRIGEVPSKGANSAGNNYEFIDLNPLLGKAYYRLRQLEINGLADYSPILTLTFDLSDEGRVQVYPNPVSDNLWISIEHKEAQHAEILLFDSQGREIQSHHWSFQLSDVQELAIEDWVPGIYAYRVKMGEKYYFGKLLKQ